MRCVEPRPKPCVERTLASAASLSWHCAFSEGLGYKLPLIFVNNVAGFVRSDFLYVDAIALEDSDHLPDAGDVLRGTGLEPTDAKAVPVTPE